MGAYECELKLSCSDSGADAILTHSIMRGSARRRPPAQTLITTYFDTPDRALFAAGWTLRLRQERNRITQTLKSTGPASATSADPNGKAEPDTDADSAGLRVRREWEAPTDGLTSPDLSLVRSWTADPDLMAILTAIESGESTLSAVVTMDIKRTKKLVQGGLSETEIAVDRGSIDAGTTRLPVCEVELELKSGRPADLFALALQLSDISDLRPAPVGKAERAFRLLQQAPAENDTDTLSDPEPTPAAKPVRAEKPGLSIANGQDIPPASSCCRTVTRSALAQIAANEAAVRYGDDPEGVHQMRIGVRRFKTALAIFGPMVAGSETEALKLELNALMNALGPARDADVFEDDILSPLTQSMGPRPGWIDLLAFYADHRAATNAAARAYLASPAFPRLLLRAGAWVEDGLWAADPSRDSLRAESMDHLAVRILSKRHKAVMKAGKGFRHLPDMARHDVRIRVKKLRYSFEFLAGLFPDKQTKPLKKALNGLQESLGGFNDVCVAQDMLQMAVDAAAKRPGPDAARLAHVAGYAAGVLQAKKLACLDHSEGDWDRFKAVPAPWNKR